MPARIPHSRALIAPSNICGRRGGSSSSTTSSASTTSIPPTIFETFPRSRRHTASYLTARIPVIPPTIFETWPRPRSYSTISLPSTRRNLSTTMSLQTAALAASEPLTLENYKVATKSIPAAAGVSLNTQQQVIAGSVLDCFAGAASLRKLTLWRDDATFTDPLTIAEGRKQYSAQWYGLKAAFSKIEPLEQKVISAGNPIELELKNKYTIKGINKEQTVESKVKIWTDGEGDNMRIKRVEDRWDDSLPDNPFANALRNLNSVTVPTMVSVPKSIEEEEGQK